MVGTLVATRAGARDAKGRFARTQATIQAEIAAKQMRDRLERDTKAIERARGVVYERRHFHSLPNADRLAVEHTGEVLPLFERAA